jgi:uncharacterized membrane protein YgcG
MTGAGAGASMARLEPKTENGITYLCGGIGREEASYMKQQAGKHDLALTFAAKDGDYLADVNVAIRDARGNPILETRCDGPMMLVDLPKGGTYRIHAETAGYALDRTVAVSGNRVATAVLTWPTPVARKGETGEAASGSSGAAGSSGTSGASGDRGSGGGERRW